jgi:ribosomal protein L7/L12
LFNALWPQLEARLKKIPGVRGQSAPTRSQHEILEELVSTVRTIDQKVRAFEDSASRLLDISSDEAFAQVAAELKEVSKLQIAKELFRAQRLMNLGQKIEAIKLVRATLNLGLKEAKDFVELWHIIQPPATQ